MADTQPLPAHGRRHRRELPLERLDDEPQVPDTGELSGDLHAYLTTIAKLLQTANCSVVVPSIIDAAEGDAGFAAVHGEIQRGHAAPVHAIIQRAVVRGELPATSDPATTAAVLLGPLFYCRWSSREPLDDAFIDAVVRHAITNLQAKLSGPAQAGMAPGPRVARLRRQSGGVRKRGLGGRDHPHLQGVLGEARPLAYPLRRT